MIAWTWKLAIRILALFVSVRGPRTWRYVCACGYRSRVQAIQAETRTCEYCYREIVPERVP